MKWENVFNIDWCFLLLGETLLQAIAPVNQCFSHSYFLCEMSAGWTLKDWPMKIIELNNVKLTQNCILDHGYNRLCRNALVTHNSVLWVTVAIVHTWDRQPFSCPSTSSVHHRAAAQWWFNLTRLDVILHQNTLPTPYLSLRVWARAIYNQLSSYPAVHTLHRLEQSPHIISKQTSSSTLGDHKQSTHSLDSHVYQNASCTASVERIDMPWLGFTAESLGALLAIDVTQRAQNTLSEPKSKHTFDCGRTSEARYDGHFELHELEKMVCTSSDLFDLSGLTAQLPKVELNSSALSKYLERAEIVVHMAIPARDESLYKKGPPQTVSSVCGCSHSESSSLLTTENADLPCQTAGSDITTYTDPPRPTWSSSQSICQGVGTSAYSSTRKTALARSKTFKTCHVSTPTYHKLKTLTHRLKRIPDGDIVKLTVPELIRLGTDAELSDGKIKSLKILRRKLKNRSSARGSASKRRSEFHCMSASHESLSATSEVLKKINLSLTTLHTQVVATERATQEGATIAQKKAADLAKKVKKIQGKILFMQQTREQHCSEVDQCTQPRVSRKIQTVGGVHADVVNKFSEIQSMERVQKRMRNEEDSQACRQQQEEDATRVLSTWTIHCSTGDHCSWRFWRCGKRSVYIEQYSNPARVKIINQQYKGCVRRASSQSMHFHTLFVKKNSSKQGLQTTVISSTHLNISTCTLIKLELVHTIELLLVHISLPMGVFVPIGARILARLRP